MGKKVKSKSKSKGKSKSKPRSRSKPRTRSKGSDRGGVCPVPKATFTTYMDEGVMHYRAAHYRKALFCFDRALDLKPNNQRALVCRSQCYLKLGDATAALRDAEASFNTKELFIRGMYQYAESLFALGQFEKALIAYQRGYRNRKDMDGFRVGVQKCREAIMTAIGDKSATQIEDLDELLPLIAEMADLLKEKRDHCCIRPGSALERKAPSKLNKPSKGRARWVAREVLGPMYFNMEYLTRFLNRPDIKSDQGSSQQLRGHANEALGYLKIREQFWRQQNPMYSRKVGLNYNNNMVLRYEELERVKHEASRRVKMDAALGAVEKNISLIEHALSINRYKDCQLECERTMRQMKEVSSRLLPRKAEFLCKILHFKGLALSKLKSYDQSIESFQQELQIATDNKMGEYKARALDSLGRVYAMKKSYFEAAECWEQRISSAKTPLERTYLCHEIGRCYFELHKMDICKYFAQQSLEEASKINDNVWLMNARLFLGQIDIKLMQLHAALENFEAAEKHASLSGNAPNVSLLRDAIQCLKVWIEKREQDDLNSTGSNLGHDMDDDDDLEGDADAEGGDDRHDSPEGTANDN